MKTVVNAVFFCICKNCNINLDYVRYWLLDYKGSGFFPYKHQLQIPQISIMKISIRKFLPLALIVTYLSCQALTAQVPAGGTATLSNPRGNVLVFDANGNQVNTTILLPGYTVVTSDEGSVVLNFSNGGVLMLDQDSRLHVNKLEVGPNGVTDTEVTLEKGDFYAAVPDDGNGSEFSVATDNANIKSMGAPFYVSHRAKTAGSNDYVTQAIPLPGPDGEASVLQVSSSQDMSTDVQVQEQGVATQIDAAGRMDYYIPSTQMLNEIVNVVTDVAAGDPAFTSTITSLETYRDSEPVRNLNVQVLPQTQSELSTTTTVTDNSVREVSPSQSSTQSSAQG